MRQQVDRSLLPVVIYLFYILFIHRTLAIRHQRVPLGVSIDDSEDPEYYSGHGYHPILSAHQDDDPQVDLNALLRNGPLNSEPKDANEPASTSPSDPSSPSQSSDTAQEHLSSNLTHADASIQMQNGKNLDTNYENLAENSAGQSETPPAQNSGTVSAPVTTEKVGYVPLNNHEPELDVSPTKVPDNFPADTSNPPSAPAPEDEAAKGLETSDEQEDKQEKREEEASDQKQEAIDEYPTEVSDESSAYTSQTSETSDKQEKDVSFGEQATISEAPLPESSSNVSDGPEAGDFVASDISREQDLSTSTTEGRDQQVMGKQEPTSDSSSFKAPETDASGTTTANQSNDPSSDPVEPLERKPNFESTQLPDTSKTSIPFEKSDDRPADIGESNVNSAGMTTGVPTEDAHSTSTMTPSERDIPVAEPDPQLSNETSGPVEKTPEASIDGVIRYSAGDSEHIDPSPFEDLEEDESPKQGFMSTRTMINIAVCVIIILIPSMYYILSDQVIDTQLSDTSVHLRKSTKMPLAELEKQNRWLKSKLESAPLSKQEEITDDTLKTMSYVLSRLKTRHYLVSEIEASKNAIKMALYDQLALLRILVDLDIIPDIERDTEWSEKCTKLKEKTSEMQVESEFIEEQMNLFRVFSKRFDEQNRSLTKSIEEERRLGDIIQDDIARLYS